MQVEAIHDPGIVGPSAPHPLDDVLQRFLGCDNQPQPTPALGAELFSDRLQLQQLLPIVADKLTHLVHDEYQVDSALGVGFVLQAHIGGQLARQFGRPHRDALLDVIQGLVGSRVGAVAVWHDLAQRGDDAAAHQQVLLSNFRPGASFQRLDPLAEGIVLPPFDQSQLETAQPGRATEAAELQVLTVHDL